MATKGSWIDLGNGEDRVGNADWSIRLDATPIEPGNSSGGTGDISATLESSPDDMFLINNRITLSSELDVLGGGQIDSTRGRVDGVSTSPGGTSISSGTILAGAGGHTNASPETLTGNIFRELIIPEGTMMPPHGTAPRYRVTAYRWIDQTEDFFENTFALGVDQEGASFVAKFDTGGRFVSIRNIRPIGTTGTRNNIAIGATMDINDVSKVNIVIAYRVSETAKNFITRYDENLEFLVEWEVPGTAAAVEDMVVTHVGGSTQDTLAWVGVSTEVILLLLGSTPASISIALRFGAPGAGAIPGTFNGIKSLALDAPNSLIYVGDSRSVQVMGGNGSLPRFIFRRTPGTSGEFPASWNNFTVGQSNGFVYVSTDGALNGHRALTAFNALDGSVAGRWTPAGVSGNGFAKLRSTVARSLLATSRYGTIPAPGEPWGALGAFGVTAMLGVKTTLGAYFQAYLGASASRSGLDLRYFPPRNTLVAYPGWEDSAWNKIKELLQVWDAEMVLADDVPTVFEQGSRETTFTERSLLVSPQLKVDSLNSSRSFDMIYHNYEYKAPGSLIYDGSANRDRAETLDMGETVVLTPQISGYIIRGVEVDVTIFDANRVEVNQNTFREWGGAVSSQLDPVTREVTVSVSAPERPSEYHPFPLTIGREREDGGLDGGLLVAAEAILFRDEKVNIRTSADPAVVTQEFGSTINNFFVSTLHDAISQGSKTATQMAGPRSSYSSYSASVASMDAPVSVGNPGRKLRVGDTTYRATSVNSANAETGFSLERHVTAKQLSELWSGKTAQEFRDFWAGQPAENIKLAPLRFPSN